MSDIEKPDGVTDEGSLLEAQRKFLELVAEWIEEEEVYLDGIEEVGFEILRDTNAALQKRII